MRILNRLCGYTFAASFALASLRRRDDPPMKYPGTITVAGQMNRTDVDFEDGFAIDLLSPSVFDMKVDRNYTLTPAFVVSTGGGSNWIHVNNHSWVITTDKPARDIVGKVEAPYVPEDLASKGVAVENTYVGQLSEDGTHWIVDETTRNVHVSENVTRIIKMSDMTGTFAILGRVGGDSANIFVQYAFGETRTVNVTAGSGLQNAPFIDGFEMQLTSKEDLKVNANINQPIQGSLPDGVSTLTQYSYVVNSSSPAAVTGARMLLPFTDFLLESTNSKNKTLAVGHRATSNDRFEMISNSTIDIRKQLVVASNLSTVDGEWVIVASAAS